MIWSRTWYVSRTSQQQIAAKSSFFVVSSVAWHGVLQCNKKYCYLDSAHAWSATRVRCTKQPVPDPSSLRKAQAPKICKSWHQDLGAMSSNVNQNNRNYNESSYFEATTSLNEVCPPQTRDKLAAIENHKQVVSWPIAGFVPKDTRPNICYNDSAHGSFTL